MTTDNSTFICCSCEYQLSESQLNKPCPECGHINTTELKLGKPVAVLANGALRAAVGFPALVLTTFAIEYSHITWHSPRTMRLDVLIALFLVPASAAWAWAVGVYVLCSPHRDGALVQKLAQGWKARFWARLHRQGAPVVAWIARHSQIGWIVYFFAWYVGEFLGPLTLSRTTPEFLLILVNFMYQVNQVYSYLLYGCLFLCYLPVMYLTSTFCEKINHEHLSRRFLLGVAVAPFCVWMLAISVYLRITYFSLIDESALAILFLFWVCAALTAISFLYLCAPWWSLYFVLRKLGQSTPVTVISNQGNNELQEQDTSNESLDQTDMFPPAKAHTP